MTLKPGDRLPPVEFTVATADGSQKMAPDVIFGGRKVVVIGLPGAFTPTCSMNHLPGFIAAHDALKALGIDTIACTAVNDIHVMKAWAKASGAEGKVTMLADGNAEFAKAAGLELDLTAAGMGLRSRRYAMLVDDGVVKALNIETERGVNASSAETMVETIKRLKGS